VKSGSTADTAAGGPLDGVTVTILNADKRIGTHVFATVARNDAGLRWTAVTIDNGELPRCDAVRSPFSAKFPASTEFKANFAILEALNARGLRRFVPSHLGCVRLRRTTALRQNRTFGDRKLDRRCIACSRANCLLAKSLPNLG
jgi:hypothetical protein